MTELIDTIDWILLADQKRWLVEQSKHSEDAAGLLHLVDTLQDWAVEVAGVSEDVVFEFGREVA